MDERDVADRRPDHGHARPGASALVAVVLLTAVGLAIRLVVAGDSLFADELSTYWIVTEHGLRGVLSTVHSNAEITPPLFFVLAWLSTKLGGSAELIRLPSLVAGTATIPLLWALGRRTVGAAPALLAAAIGTVAPFLVYYSAEARGYALLMALITLSTLAMLLAVDTGRRRWWALYAAASCGAMYSHYTGAFALGAQLVWLWWAHPEARRAALVANAAAVVGFLPWATGLHNDLTSPTSDILSALSPFNPREIRIVLEHWTVAYPYASVSVRDVPGTLALALMGLGVLVAATGAVRQRLARRGLGLGLDRRVVLVVALALSVPVGEAAVSLVSTNLFGVRNLAASWPAFALTLAAVLMAAGPRLRVGASALVLAGFVAAGVQMVRPAHRRPDYGGAVAYITDHARPGDAVIDATGVLSPGPLTAFDSEYRRRDLEVFRAGAPAERAHPFGFGDPLADVRTAIPQALAASHGGRVYVVRDEYPRSAAYAARQEAVRHIRFPPAYRLVERRRYPGFATVTLLVYAAR